MINHLSTRNYIVYLYLDLFFFTFCVKLTLNGSRLIIKTIFVISLIFVIIQKTIIFVFSCQGKWGYLVISYNNLSERPSASCDGRRHVAGSKELCSSFLLGVNIFMTHIIWEKYIRPIRCYDQVWCLTRITIATFDSRQTWSVFFNILEFLRHSMYFEIVISYMGVKIMSKYFGNYLIHSEN